METKINAMREELLERGFSLNVRQRKLASGPKLYFRVKNLNDGDYYSSAISTVNKIIRKYFKDAYMTSGSLGMDFNCMFAEY